MGARRGTAIWSPRSRQAGFGRIWRSTCSWEIWMPSTGAGRIRDRVFCSTSGRILIPRLALSSCIVRLNRSLPHWYAVVPYQQTSWNGAARSWVATNRELLRFHHRNRERSRLVNGDRLLQSPEQFIAQVGEDFQVPLAPPETGLVLASAASSALAALLVKGLPWEDPEAAALYAELEATADLGANQQDLARPTVAQAVEEFHGLLTELQQASATASSSANELGRLQETILALSKDKEESCGSRTEGR